MEEASEVDFTTLMRRKTRGIHNISDSLVQSKFVIGKEAHLTKNIIAAHPFKCNFSYYLFKG